MITRSKRRRLDHEIGSWTEGDEEIEWHEQTKEEMPEYTARVKRIKTDLNRLRINDLRRELCSARLPEAGKKRDLVDRLIPHRLEALGSPFDLLPDEIVLKIFKMATWLDPDSYHRYPYNRDYDFIMWNLCMVSERFNRITRDSSLWEDLTVLRLDMHVAILDRVTKWFLHDGMTRICIGGSYYALHPSQYSTDHEQYPAITSDHIAIIANKCPNLKTFEVGKVNIEPWPAVCMPALERLSMMGPSCDPNMFREAIQ